MLVGHQKTPWTARFNPKEPDYLISGDFTGSVYYWNWKRGFRVNEALCREGDYVFTIEFLPEYSINF